MSAADLGESLCTFSVSVCVSKTVMHQLAVQVQRCSGFWKPLQNLPRLLCLPKSSI